MISVGLCLDYAIHVAEEFLQAEGTGNERLEKAVGLVGKAVFNGGPPPPPRCSAHCCRPVHR